MQGGSSDSLVRQVTLTTGILAGQPHDFRYRVRNIHGWSPSWSPVGSIRAASVPSAPAAATTSLSASTVTVTWSAPSSNGSPILSYVVEIQAADGSWHQYTSTCDGADAGVLAAASCTIPQSVLTATNLAFQLTRGTLVVARVSAANLLGTGPTSTPNTSGARIQTLPGAPTGLTSGAASTESQIQISWNALTTDSERGGVAPDVVITSYHVEWQRGSSTGPWAELAGLSSAYTATTYTTSPGNPAQVVVAGDTYYFRVRA